LSPACSFSEAERRRNKFWGFVGTDSICAVTRTPQIFSFYKAGEKIGNKSLDIAFKKGKNRRVK